MFDRSGSMKDDNKWGASSEAMKSFFADGSVSGLEASLQFFPQYEGDNLSCDTQPYQAPLVTMQPIPATAFGGAIDGTKLLETTPTLPALNGAIAYAKEVQANGKKAAVVLITDGEPNHCDSDITSVSKAAQDSAAAIKTYVIGVGDNLTNLNAIAAAGGTTSAIIVSTSNPGNIAGDLKKALGFIAAAAMTCDYSIPVPPNGQTIDPAKVNVRRTPSSGTGTTLTYNAQCTGEGWHYDNANNPSRILLCPSTCDGVMKDPGAKIEVFFGCAVKGGIPK
jgi:hypothetical protein